MMEESEEEPNDGGRESDEDDIELIEDSTDEEMELETEGDTAEEDNEQNQAAHDPNFSMRDFNMDLEFLPNESALNGMDIRSRNIGGGLLQVSF